MKTYENLVHMKYNPKVSYFRKTLKTVQLPVAHACNPRYLGGRDQEHEDFKASPGK
jgi:hypothetical protein